MGNFIFKEESKVNNDVKYDDIKDNDIDDVKEETNDDVKEETNDVVKEETNDVDVVDDVKEETNDDVDDIDDVKQDTNEDVDDVKEETNDDIDDDDDVKEYTNDDVDDVKEETNDDVDDDDDVKEDTNDDDDDVKEDTNDDDDDVKKETNDDVDDVEEETNDDDVKEETNDDTNDINDINDTNDINDINETNHIEITERDLAEEKAQTKVMTDREFAVAHCNEFLCDAVVKLREANAKEAEERTKKRDVIKAYNEIRHHEFLKKRLERESEEIKEGLRQQAARELAIAQGVRGPSMRELYEAVLAEREAKAKEAEERALLREQKEIEDSMDFLNKKGIYPNVEGFVEVYKNLHSKFSGISTSDDINEIMTSIQQSIVHDLRVLDCPDFIQSSKNKDASVEVKPIDENNDIDDINETNVTNETDETKVTNDTDVNNNNNNIETCYACKKEFVCPHNTTDRCKQWSCAEKEFGEYPISRMHTNSNLDMVHVHLCSRVCDETLSEEYRTMLRSRGVNVIVIDDEDEEDYLSDD